MFATTVHFMFNMTVYFIYILSVYIYAQGCPCGVMVNALDRVVVVSEFELPSC